MEAKMNPLLDQVRYFATSSEAWAFMRECDDKGIMAGYPSLNAGALGYSVQFRDNEG